MKVDLDIIIPCYNAKKTILNTLDSIKIQKDVSGFKVYLINDKSDYSYQEEVDYYSNYFNIQEITLEDNLGPGGARREGLAKTNSKYVMFIDSDDILYSPIAINHLYRAVQGHDVCISNFILERDGVKVVKEQNTIWLHGKIYNRDFLNKYKITFNDSRANEDNGFNRLVLLMEPDIICLNEVTYVYRDYEDSITRKNNREFKIIGLKGYVYNMIWAMKEALKRGADPSFIPNLTTGTLISMYYDYLYNINEPNVNLLLEYSKDMLPYYKKADDELFNAICEGKEKIFKEENKEYQKVITFDEFIKKVEEYD